jgi:hypothetical protein
MHEYGERPGFTSEKEKYDKNLKLNIISYKFLKIQESVYFIF